MRVVAVSVVWLALGPLVAVRQTPSKSHERVLRFTGVDACFD